MMLQTAHSSFPLPDCFVNRASPFHESSGRRGRAPRYNSIQTSSKTKTVLGLSFPKPMGLRSGPGLGQNQKPVCPSNQRLRAGDSGSVIEDWGATPWTCPPTKSPAAGKPSGSRGTISQQNYTRAGKAMIKLHGSDLKQRRRGNSTSQEPLGCRSELPQQGSRTAGRWPAVPLGIKHRGKGSRANTARTSRISSDDYLYSFRVLRGFCRITSP